MQANADARARYLPIVLREVRDDLFNYAIPEMSTGDAKEHIQFAYLTLDHYVAELEVEVQLTRTFYGEYLALISEIEKALVIVAAADTSNSLEALRTRLSATIVPLSEYGLKGAVEAQRSALWRSKIVALESRVKQIITAAQKKSAYQPPQASELPARRMTAENLNACLRRHFPTLPPDPVVSLTVLPGGRSKKTVFATLKPNDVLPAEVVIRQDMPGGPVDTTDGVTTVAREYPVLRALVGKGLPIATPLMMEYDESECGAPFMMVERLQGVAPGTFFGFFSPQDPEIQSAVRDMARVLATLHSIDPNSLGLPEDPRKTPEARLLHEVEYRWNKWSCDSHRPSPIIECALARMRAECKPGLGETALVHGDTLSHNLLVKDGKVTALLDWEFVHVGDPAQDLAYCRHAVEQCIPWQEFMSIYLAAGGRPISEKRLAIYGLVGLVRNCSFSATCMRLVVSGESNDLTVGASGVFAIALMEPQIVALLEKLDLLDRGEKT